MPKRWIWLQRGRNALTPRCLGRPDAGRFRQPTSAGFWKRWTHCTEPGAIGSLLRREGLHSSRLTKWRRQREEGVLNGLAPRKRGPGTEPVNPLAQRVAAQEREIERLRKKLEQAAVIIDFQKKVSELLGIAMTPEKDGRLP